MTPKRRKDDETIDKVYKLLVDEVLPVKDDIAGIKKDIERINGSFERRCAIVDKKQGEQDNDIKRLDRGKIGKALIITLSAILAFLITLLNLPSAIMQFPKLFGG